MKISEKWNIKMVMKTEQKLQNISSKMEVHMIKLYTSNVFNHAETHIHREVI